MIFPAYFYDFRSIFDALLFTMLKLSLFSEIAVSRPGLEALKLTERL